MELSSLANGWVESYLEALLTTGLSAENAARVQDPSKAEQVANADTQICAKYYVQQILGLDEYGIRQAWNKAHRSSASQSPTDKDARLEYLSWRVWGMRRKREVVLAEQAHDQDEDEVMVDSEFDYKSEALDTVEMAPLQLANLDSETSPVLQKQRQLRLQVSAASESSLDDISPPYYDTIQDFEGLEISSQIRPDNQRLYVIMISMHGLVRGEGMELGKDPDTGGQVKYVVELAKAMALQPGVHRVDLLTRLIQDPKVDASYGQPEERLVAGEGELGGAYIVRLPCGNSKKYLRKEALWPHVREFADHGIAHAKATMARLQAAGHPCQLQAIHGHYADAGEAAALMSHTLDVNMLLTGHSLGRNKLDHLLKSGTLSRAEIEATYAIGRRIEGEERALDAAILVFTSTQQEVADQWGLYNGYNLQLEHATRSRPRRGRRFPHMEVIPPGLDFSALKVDLPLDPLAPVEAFGRPPTTASSSPRRRGSSSNLVQSPRSTQRSGSPSGSPRAGAGGPLAPMREDPPIWREIFRFLRNPRKPVILAMSRPDAKKNITSLVQAFGECRPLRDLANLVLIMGNRDVIDSMAGGSQKVLNQVLHLIDAYDLYGSVAYPKHHTQHDISDIYLLPAATRGVFVNVALQEPFGLTLIEAAAHAVPIVATKHGGPVDIIATLNNGILVEPTDISAISRALLKIVTEPDTWDDLSSAGRANIMAYSWPAHCSRYLQKLDAERARASKEATLHSSYSASFDAAPMRAALADAVSAFAGGNSAFAAAAANAAAATTMGLGDLSLSLADRHASMPLLPHAAAAATPPAATTPTLLSPLPSGMSTDDLLLPSLNSGFSVASGAATPTPAALPPRPRYLVLALDSPAAAPHLAALLRTHPALAPPGAGLGLASALSHRATLAALDAAGLPLASFDFLITGAGSEIHYPYPSPSPAAPTKLSEDPTYEAHVDHCWDRLALKRTIVRLLSSTSLFTAAAAPHHPTKPASPRRSHSMALVDSLSKAGSMQLAGAFRLRRDVGHFHLEVDIPKPTPAILAKLPALIRQRLRAAGMRTHLTARADPSSSSLLLHLTPLRASRALALRFLAHANDLPMGAFTLLTAGKLAPGGARVGLCTSDGEELLGGSLPVVVADVPGLKAATLFERPLDIYHARVQLLEAAVAAAEAEGKAAAEAQATAAQAVA